MRIEERAGQRLGQARISRDPADVLLGPKRAPDHLDGTGELREAGSIPGFANEIVIQNLGTP